MQCTLPLVLLAAAGAARAQVGDVIVASDLGSGTFRTELLRVDPATGTTTALPRAGVPATATPQAVYEDPVTGDILLALVDFGRTVVHRLRPQAGSTPTRGALTVPPLTGEVVDLAVGSAGAVYAAVRGPAGGVWRLPRTSDGSPSVQLIASTDVSAMWSPPLSDYAWLVESGPGRNAALSQIDLATGTRTQPPVAVPLANAIVTGVADLPTGAIRQVLTDELGRLHLFEFLSQLQTLPLTPPLPAGATQTLRLRGTSAGLGVLLLGDDRRPFLVETTVFGGTPGIWRDAAGPLPGRPVDFADVDDTPRFVPYGKACGPTIIATGSPSPFAFIGLGMRGAPANAPALLVIGLDDQRAGPFRLPAPLPGSCQLLASPDLTVPLATDATGAITVTVQLPGRPGLFFAQWLVADASGSLQATAATSVVVR